MFHVTNIELNEENNSIPNRPPNLQPIRVVTSALPLLSSSVNIESNACGSFSNSSWKSTMHPIIIGVNKLYPLSIEMEQRLILHYLIPTCEYQDVCYF